MEELDLKEITSILWRKKFIILIIILIFIVLGAVYSYKLIVPDYKASTTLILGRINSSSSDILSQSGKDTNQITQSEITINSNLVSTYSELIKSKSLTQKVKDNLNIDIEDKEFTKNINVSRISETELIEITVTNKDPKLAADIANEIAKVFSEKIEEIYNISNVYIIDRAVENYIPYNINHLKDIAIFFVLGVVVSLGYVIIYSMLDTTIKSNEDIEKDIGLKNLVSIPIRKEVKKEQYLNELITYNDSKSVNSEVFKTLRTNVQFSNINNKENKVMLLTSCFSSEGKSYISANLATVFAQAGKKVVLIDADMRRGRQSKIFNLPNELGLSNYLSNLDNTGMEINERINKYINETQIKNLNVITSGNVPPNPSELLTSNKLPELIKELNIFYDLIIFDGAPVLPIADSLILARMANSTILVSLYNKTKKDELLKAKKDIQNVGGRIIGTVLNKVPTSSHDYDNKYYYYGMDEDTSRRKKRRIETKNKGKFKAIKNKIERTLKKIKAKIDDKLKNRIKNKIKLLSAGKNTIKLLDDNKSVKEYEIELKRLENEKKELAKQEQAKKKKEQEKQERERQKAREELVKIKEVELINKNIEKQKQEIKLQEEKQKEIKKIEEAKKQGLEELERRKKEAEEAKKQAEIKEQEEKEKLRLVTEEKAKQEEKIKEEARKKEEEKQKEEARKREEEEKQKEEARIKEEERKKQELENEQKKREEKQKQEEEKRKIAEAKKQERQEKKEEFKKNFAENTEKAKQNFNEFKSNLKVKIDETSKRLGEIKADTKSKLEKNKKIREENRIKKKELRDEKQKAEREENEIRKQRELEERERIRLIREEERKERDIELEKERQIRLEKKLEEKVKKAQAREEKRKFREKERQRIKEEERIKEQILEDNLYPKTKYNKDL